MFLELVYPPISNQEAEWVKDEKEVQDICKESNLYMIGQRSEAHFCFGEKFLSKNNRFLKFTIKTKDASSFVALDVGAIICANIYDDSCEAELDFGPKIIRLWKVKSDTGEKIDLIAWYTTEKLLYNRWRCSKYIYGLKNYREFSRYKLHYVGISKKSDSMQRLMVQPHDKRLRILGNEFPFNETSRPTDELVLFFFRINPLHIKIMDCKSDDETFIEEMLGKVVPSNIDNVSDAEKAFVKIMQSAYNSQRYDSYPKGKDGLYDAGLSRYGYIIREGISFETEHTDIDGEYFGDDMSKMDHADMIFVSGEEVDLVKHS